MAKVKRSNIFLTIPDDEVSRYLAKGYSLVDKDGNVIKSSIPTEYNELRKAYLEQVEINKKLTSEVSQLKSLLNSAEGTKPSAAPKGEVEESWDDWASEEEEKPKKKRNTKN